MKQILDQQEKIIQIENSNDKKYYKLKKENR